MTTASESEAASDRAGSAEWLPERFVERLGAALVAPRRALRAAMVPGAAGRSGNDAAALLGLTFLAAHTREVVTGVWIAAAESVRMGLGTIASALSRAVSMDLAVLFVAAALLTVAAGRKRSLGRDFDLACIAFVPFLAVKLVATLVVQAADIRLTDALQWIVAALAYGWSLVVLVLAWQEVRGQGGEAHGSAVGTPRARGAGLIVLALAGVVLGGNVAWVARNLDTLRPLLRGDVAPAFTLRAVDEHGHLAARTISLQDLRGKVAILDFWATWCGPCRESLPAIERIYQRHRQRGLEVVSVNIDDAAKGRAMLEALGLTFPLYIDDGTVADRYGVSTIPHLVLIDPTGVVRRVHRGAVDEDDLEREVRRLLPPGQ